MKNENETDTQSIEEIFTKIETLIDELESGKEPLDTVLAKFKEAVGLYQKASGLLRDAKVKVTEMMRELEGEKDGELPNELVEPDTRIKTASSFELEQLASEVRSRIFEVVSKNGGHLSLKSQDRRVDLSALPAFRFSGRRHARLGYGPSGLHLN